jgi:ABC-type antimicrobial peptide transport system permease subunit
MGLIGGVVGIAGAIALGRTAESMLYGLDGWNLSVLATATVLLAFIVLVSGYLPARRASRVAPMEALRYE